MSSYIPTAMHSLTLLQWEKNEKFTLNTSIFDTFPKIKHTNVFDSGTVEGKKNGVHSHFMQLFSADAKIHIFLKGLYFKPSGDYIVAPIFCLLS